MSLWSAVDWLFGILAVTGVLWTLVKSVRVKVRVNVRKVTPEEQETADAGGPKITIDAKTRFEHGKPIHFGTRSAQPK